MGRSRRRRSVDGGGEIDMKTRVSGMRARTTAARSAARAVASGRCRGRGRHVSFSHSRRDREAEREKGCRCLPEIVEANTDEEFSSGFGRDESNTSNGASASTSVVETTTTTATTTTQKRKGATYFTQDHEFRIDFDHAVQLSFDEDVDGDPETEDLKVNAGEKLLKEWITNPELLLIASYGEDNVKLREVSEMVQEENESTSSQNSVWCVTLPRVKLLSWTVIPMFDIRASVKPNGVIFTSDRIVLDGIGIPDSLRNTKIEFSLFSKLYVQEEDPNNSNAKDHEAQIPLSSNVSTMIAQNALTLGVYLPKAVSRLPGVKRTGTIIVRTILNSVDRTAKKELMKSFQEYIRSKFRR